MAKAKTSGFVCMECGHKFKTVKAAEKAAYGAAGCPKCGGADIDMPALGCPVASRAAATNPGAALAAHLGVPEHESRTATLTVVS